MFNTYFDMAFADFYNKWIVGQIVFSELGNDYFEKLNKNSTIKGFMSFLEEEKNKIELKEKFDSLYNKEYVKSFVLYLYKNIPEILENRKEVNREEYDLIWLSSFFDKIAGLSVLIFGFVFAVDKRVFAASEMPSLAILL